MLFPFAPNLQAFQHSLWLAQSWSHSYVFSMLPSYVTKQSNNLIKFKLILQKFLYRNSFYSLDEYFELKKNIFMISISIQKFAI